MRFYEWARVAAEPFLPVLHQQARQRLYRLIQESGKPDFKLLDVGGRKSPYTIGLPAEITIIDLPRQSELQRSLNLGLSDQLLRDIQKKRSNVCAVILEDMVRCTLPAESFDGVACIEVIEHVEADQAFVSQVWRVLKPGGWAFFSTPNGDYIRNDPPNHNPDHQRHYRKAELEELLGSQFGAASVWYGVKTGKNRYRGLRSLSLKRPLRAIVTMVSNLLSYIESRGLETQPRRTAHLFALVRKL